MILDLDGDQNYKNPGGSKQNRILIQITQGLAKVKLEKKTDGTKKYSTFAGFLPSPLEEIHHHKKDVK